MAFPTSPTNGQQYTTNGQTYQWNSANGTWDKVGTTAAPPTAIFNGNSNVVVTANSNVTVSVAGNANVVTVTGTGANVAGTLNATGTLDVTGNANVGNLNTAIVLATGNISGANINTSGTVTATQLISNVATGTAPLTVTSTTQIANLNVAVAGSVVNGTSNVNIPVNNGNINFSAAGTANVAVITSTGANITGTANISGNANVGNIGGATAVLTVAANVPLVQNGNSNVAVDANSHVRISANGKANLVYVAANGNIGVGTASPTAKLDISGSVTQNVVAVSASDIDCSTGNYFTKTASGALTWTFSNVPASRSMNVILVLTNGGTGTQTWPAAVKWPGGTAPSLTAAGVDLLAFVTDDSGTTWRGVMLMKDSK